MKLSNVRFTHLVATMAVAGLVLAACGSDDEGDDGGAAATAEAGDETTADDPATAADDEGAEPADGDDQGGDEDNGDDGDVVTVDDLGDVPEECIEAMGDFLEQLEPIVSDIDWQSATMADFEAISEQLDTELSELDEPENCTQYEFSDDVDSLAMAREIAEDRAPGVLPYLDWVSDLAEQFSTDASGDGAAADVPADCESAVARMEEIMDEFSTMSEVSLAELTEIGNVTGAIGEKCSVEEAGEFFQRQDVQDFMAG